MEHDLAIKNQAVERYILAEMPPQEREAFEEHFFTCELCAADIRTMTAFLEGAKAVFKDPPPVQRPSRRFAWSELSGRLRLAFAIPTAVAAACVALIAYQDVAVIPVLKAPQSLSSGVPLDGSTRSKAPTVAKGTPLHFQLPWEGGASRNRVWAEIDNGSKPVSSGEVAVPAANQPLDLYFPGTIDPGHYTVDVRDGPQGKELVHGDFEVTP